MVPALEAGRDPYSPDPPVESPPYLSHAADLACRSEGGNESSRRVSRPVRIGGCRARRDDRARVQPEPGVHHRVSGGGVRGAPRRRSSRRSATALAVVQGAPETGSYLPVPPEQPFLLPHRRRGAARDRAARRPDEDDDAVPAAAERADGAIGGAGARARARGGAPDGHRATCARATRSARRSPRRSAAGASSTRRPAASRSRRSRRIPRCATRRRPRPIPWDGRPSREAAFAAKLTAAAPGVEIKDLDPILDALRVIKTPREIALIREATRIAGLGLMEAMRAARPGCASTRSRPSPTGSSRPTGRRASPTSRLVAAGKNAIYPHYHGGSAELKPEDLVLFDYAPDYRYYASDVTRMFPASGRFSPRAARALRRVPEDVHGAHGVDSARRLRRATSFATRR